MSNILYTYDLYAYCCRQRPSSLFDLDRAVNEAIAMKREYPGFLYEMQIQQRLRKDAQEFAEYQNQDPLVMRNSGNDRVFPLETVAVQHFRAEHDMDIEDVAVHYGPGSDELARSYHALAITIGTDIFFRNNAYQPESEEGQKLLAHEMAHIAQYEEGRTGKNHSREELEAEAERSERRELAEYNPDPYVPLAAGNKLYHVRKSKRDEFIKLAAGEVRQYVRDRRYYMDKERYLCFLRAYEKWLKER